MAGNWTASQNISLDTLRSLPAAVLIQSWDRTPRIRSVSIYNQSSVAFGVFVERAPGGKADFVVGSYTLFAMPIGVCSAVVFQPYSLGVPFSGSAVLGVTEDVLAPANSALPTPPLGTFVLDQSLLDGANTLS